MRDSSYVRPKLTATRHGVPDPVIEVEAWLDRLETTLAAEGPEWSAHGAYDLLAAWGKLKRARSDLIHSLGGDQQLAEAQRTLSEHGPELARLALTVPNPRAWREESVALEASYERLIDPVERSTLAERLITDLDDAELVLHAAGSLGITDSILEQEIEECRLWLMEHADLFLAAGVHTQAVGMALRPDLSEYDYFLAMTALKYERLLDAAEEIEAELALEGVSPIDREEVDALCRRWVRQQRLAVASAAFPRSLLGSAKLAAASEAKTPPMLKWSAPEGGLVAYLPLVRDKVNDEPQLMARETPILYQASEAEADKLTIHFYRSDGARATSLAGQPVVLAGIAGRIDSGAKAQLSLKAFKQSKDELRLVVGDDNVTWHPELE